MSKKYVYSEGPELLHCHNGGFKKPDDFSRRQIRENGGVPPYFESRVFRIQKVRTKVATLVKPLWSERKAMKLAKEVIEEKLK